jgi:hypothetical protein
MIMDEAFHDLDASEEILRREVLAAVVLLQTPFSMDGIVSLLGMSYAQIESDLSPFHSVIHVPSTKDGHVSIFHASFREFIVDRERCKQHSVNYTQGHQMLSVQNLQLLNKSLRHNICNLSEDTVGAIAHEIPNPSIISEAVQYSSLFWAYHLGNAFSPFVDIAPALEPLSTFADQHLLHWFECLSALGELESGLKSLGKAKETISVSIRADDELLLMHYAEICQDACGICVTI